MPRTRPLSPFQIRRLVVRAHKNGERLAALNTAAIKDDVDLGWEPPNIEFLEG